MHASEYILLHAHADNFCAWNDAIMPHFTHLPVFNSLRFCARFVTGEFIFDGAVLFSAFKKFKLLLRFFSGRRRCRAGFFEMLFLDIFQSMWNKNMTKMIWWGWCCDLMTTCTSKCRTATLVHQFFVADKENGRTEYTISQSKWT